MEEIKKLVSFGRSKDEEKTDDVQYGNPNVGSAGTITGGSNTASNTGAVAGEGSHLRSSANPSDTTTGTSGSTSTAGLGSGANTALRPKHLNAAAEDNASTQGIRSGVVGGDPSAPSHLQSSNQPTSSLGTSHTSAQQTLPDRTATSGFDNASASQSSAERSFPLGSSGTTSQTTGSTAGQSHLGRDAALAGGAGMAGTGASNFSRPTKSSSTTDPFLTHEHGGHGHTFEPSATAEAPVEGYIHHIKGPHSTDIANALDPHVPGEFPSESGVDVHSRTSHHTSSTLGAGSGIGAGAGAAALGSHQLGGSHHPSAATSTGGYDDQRFDPAAASTSSQSTSTGYPSSTSYPPGSAVSSEQHRSTHGGAGVGTAAGATAAGVGAYELSKNHQGGADATGPASKTVGPHKSNVMNVVDPRVLPEPENQDGRTNAAESHHYGRDAAVAGGAGAVGLGGYEASRHTGTTAQQQTTSTSQYPTGSTAGTSSSTGSHQSGTLNRADPRVDSDLSKGTKDRHYGRDAAVVGGAGGAGLAGYEATKKDHLAPQHAQQPLATPTGAPQDARVFDQTQKVPESKQTQAGWATDTKTQEKLEKERAKEASKAHEKAVKDDGSKGEKKHGLLGFLHREKNDTPEEKTLKEHGNYKEADQAAHIRHQRELEAAAGTGAVGVAGASFEPSLKEQQQHPDASSPQRLSTDEKGHHKLHKEPPAKVQRELEERSRESGDGIVIEPHTGLPMNVGKYGTGHGGTDGSNTVPGYHEH